MKYDACTGRIKSVSVYHLKGWSRILRTDSSAIVSYTTESFRDDDDYHDE